MSFSFWLCVTARGMRRALLSRRHKHCSICATATMLEVTARPACEAVSYDGTFLSFFVF